MSADKEMVGKLGRESFEAAAQRIAPYIEQTELLEVAPGLWVKAEHEQITGSFKLRGALNKVLQLDEDERTAGVICASAGNHGLGVAKACQLFGMRCTVYLPESAPDAKASAIRALGGQLRPVSGGYGVAERVGLRAAREAGAVWISPYNDLDVIAGQGTIGLELGGQMVSAVDPRPVVYVPASGGGLVCGVGLALRAVGSDTTVVAVQTTAAPYLHAAISGRDLASVVERPTIADGLAGPVQPGSVTLSLLPRAAGRVELVEESEIVSALAWLVEAGITVEPSAAVAMAAALRAGAQSPRIVILTGSNVDRELIDRVLLREPE